MNRLNAGRAYRWNIELPTRMLRDSDGLGPLIGYPAWFKVIRHAHMKFDDTEVLVVDVPLSRLIVADGVVARFAGRGKL